MNILASLKKISGHNSRGKDKFFFPLLLFMQLLPKGFLLKEKIRRCKFLAHCVKEALGKK
jgi:hypothetical protein